MKDPVAELKRRANEERAAANRKARRTATYEDVPLPTEPPPRNGSHPTANGSARRLHAQRASDIRTRKVRWLWAGRLPLGMLSLLAGSEGLGKSLITIWLAARVTRGDLPGEFWGRPRCVIIAATEDTWEEVIAPRLAAAGADLTKILRINAVTGTVLSGLEFPLDIANLTALIREHDVTLIIFDPLISRLGAKDTHRDAEVRQALEPIAEMLAQTRASAVGLIHVTKVNTTVILDKIMGSKAFTAVARSVSVVMRHPADDGVRLFATPKNNVGRDDLPTLTYRVESVPVETTEDGTADTGRVAWGADSDLTLTDAMAGDGPGGGEALAEAVDWLADHLDRVGRELSADVKKAARKEEISAMTLARARLRLGVNVVAETTDKGRRTWWHQKGYEGGSCREDDLP